MLSTYLAFSARLRARHQRQSRWSQCTAPTLSPCWQTQSFPGWEGWRRKMIQSLSASIMCQVWGKGSVLCIVLRRPWTSFVCVAQSMDCPDLAEKKVQWIRKQNCDARDIREIIFVHTYMYLSNTLSFPSLQVLHVDKESATLKYSS